MQSQAGSTKVWYERKDGFKIDGIWLYIPICGYVIVDEATGVVVFWKDFWDYKKYKAFVTEKFGADFKLFRKKP